MLTNIIKKTLWKYNSDSDNYNKILINNILKKDKNSIFFSIYQRNNKINTGQSYIYKLYNLYQSIKLLINLTENSKKDLILYNPILLNKFFYKCLWKNIENKNKIIVNKKSNIINRNENKNRNNDIKIDNSLSSIKKTIDLDDKDNIQKGCLDFATGNEMEILLKNFQRNPNECLYKNYYKNCNVYKKKKSPYFSFRVFSPKNNNIFGENEIYRNSIKNRMINNNIFINNNNYNNNTNYIINNYKDIKGISKMNEIQNYNNFNNEDNLNIEKKYNHFIHLKSQSKNNILSNKTNCRNKHNLPQSQSCERFIYKKKYIYSQSKKKKLRNKTVEEQDEEEDEEKEENDSPNENKFKKINGKCIKFDDKTSNVKNLEKEINNDDTKIIKIHKLNYIERNEYDTNKSYNKNKFPYLLSRITKNIKNNRKANIIQEKYKTRFNSTFNISYLTNYKTKELKVNKSKIENSLSKNVNVNRNTDYNKNNNKDNKKENKNNILNIIKKKGKKSIKRKDYQLKLKKNYTSLNNLNYFNSKNVFADKLCNTENIKKDIKPKDNKKNKKEIKELKKNNITNIINLDKIISPVNNRDILTQIASPEQNKFKDKIKKISYKELLNKKILHDFSKMNKSNRNLHNFSYLNRNNISNIKRPSLISCKSNYNINYLSNKLFSPIKKESIKTTKINELPNNCLKFQKNLNDYDSNNIINNTDKNNNYFNTLPNYYFPKENQNIKGNPISTTNNNKNELNSRKITENDNKITQVPIKVNLNKKTLIKSSSNYLFYNKQKKMNSKNDYNDFEYTFTTAINISRHNNSGKDKKKFGKNIKIKIN